MKRTIYQNLTGDYPVVVTEKEFIRTLRFGGDEKQSCIDMLQPHKLQLSYTKWMMTGLLIPPKLNRVLVCGLGGGAIVHFLHHHHPNLEIDIVEKDKRVIKIAKTLFSLSTTPKIKVYNDDITDFLCKKAKKRTYDVIFVDIFGQGCMAPALYASGLYRELIYRLTKDGVLTANLWSGKRDLFFLAISALREGCRNQFMQMMVKKRSNSIILAFPETIPKRTLRKIRKEAHVHQQRYHLPFHKYLKKMRRTNKFLNLVQYLGNFDTV